MLLLLVSGGLLHLAYGLDTSSQINNVLAIVLYAVVVATVTVTHIQGALLLLLPLPNRGACSSSPSTHHCI